jgi:DivIVA domain-containing protein
MDLTPQLLTEVEFSEQWRGYSKNDVDDFLERVAVAVGELQERLRDATARAEQAEQQRSSGEDEIRNALVLAQRAATNAVEEAKAEAARLRSEAAERAATELGELEQRRVALEAELTALTSRVEAQRASLRAELERYLAELAEPFVPPAATGAPVAPPPPPTPAAEPDGAPTADEVQHAREELVDALRRAGVEPVEDAPANTIVFDDADEDEGDDPFLAELRRAVTDDAPLGPRDDE